MTAFKKKVNPGDLLSEYDTVLGRCLGKYIILWMDDFEFQAYCLYDITGFFTQGDVVEIGHDEIRDTERYSWVVTNEKEESNKAQYDSSSDAAPT